jgi:hypothetical protein
MEKKEITAVDYDGLLKIFCCSDDDLRPELKQPNTIGDKTYATDAYSMMIIPNDLLRVKYGLHQMTPDFKQVLKAVKECPPEKFKDTDLFKALQVHPKEYDTCNCAKCDGDGYCSHCDALCERCGGDGYIIDKSKPMIYSETGTIQIGEQYFFPRQLGRLEKVVVELMVEEFTIVGRSSMAAMIKVGPVELLICRMDFNGHDKLPNTVLTPIQ